MIKYFLILLILFLSCNTKKSIEDNYIKNLVQETPNDIPLVFGEDIVSKKGRFEMGITISPNGKNIAFGVAHESKPEETCIYLMSFANKKWSSPDKTILPNNINTFFPMFSPSGDELYFAKSNEKHETDLWVAKYQNSKIIDPRPLDSIFNSKSREAGHGKSKIGSFYFTSNRNDQNQCCGDIYYSKLESDGYKTIQKVNELSSGFDEESLYLAPDENYIIVQSWKTEFKSKHDLYISYRTKDSLWTTPKRLNNKINSKEIEQRPFISSDNKFLFFSRMSSVKEKGKDVYESDIYWVNTKSIFKPYPYNTEIKYSIKQNEQIQLKLPNDLFKDVDDENLSFEAYLENNIELPEWIKFDSNNLSFRGIWKSKEPIKIIIIATDTSGNNTEFKFQLAEETL